MNVRQACGYTCGICDAWKTATDSALSPSPTPVGTTKGEAAPSTPSGPDDGSAEVNVGIGSGTPEKQCKDIAPAWACKGLKKMDHFASLSLSTCSQIQRIKMKLVFNGCSTPGTSTYMLVMGTEITGWDSANEFTEYRNAPNRD
ncbi:hypothetical protein AAVH_14623 [Aphelenchoides avenae]|nr:hypothetical protein AAVH_14623 [Aphelenchus avenae]